jgi:hypothetical protein
MEKTQMGAYGKKEVAESKLRSGSKEILNWN